MNTQLKLEAAQVLVGGQVLGTLTGTIDHISLDALFSAPTLMFTAAGGGVAGEPVAMTASEAPSADAGGDVGQEFAAEQLVRWDGERFAGFGHVEMYKGDDLIVRLHTNEWDGRDNVRVRLSQADQTSGNLVAVNEIPAVVEPTPEIQLPEGFIPYAARLRDLDTEGNTFYLRGTSFEGTVTVLAHKRRARQSGKLFGTLTDLRSGREGVKVSVTQADVDAGRVYVAEEEEVFEHTNENVIASVADARKGQSISLAGDLAEGFGEVVKVVQGESVSVRVQDETTGDKKRIKLNPADLRQGKLARYENRA